MTNESGTAPVEAVTVGVDAGRPSLPIAKVSSWLCAFVVMTKEVPVRGEADLGRRVDEERRVGIGVAETAGGVGQRDEPVVVESKAGDAAAAAGVQDVDEVASCGDAGGNRPPEATTDAR